MAGGIVHGGGLTAAVDAYGGSPADWLDLSTGINPNMPELPDIPTEVWNRLPDRGLVDEARAAARDWYLGSEAAASPPSVLPDISPTRGESSKSYAPRVKETSRTEHATNPRAKTLPQLFSPLVAEMSGRTEEGKSGSVGKPQTSDYLPLPVPGTQSFIQILPKLVPQNRPIAILSPTYGEYAHCFRKAGFRVDAIGALEELRPDHGMLVVVNPNNPDGRTFVRDDLLDIHARLLVQQGHLHIDEAFGDSRPELSIAGDACDLPSLTVSRSFGKFFGMAGVRLGFVFARPETLQVIEAELGPWAVSGPALHIASRLMQVDRTPILAAIGERRRALQTVLTGAGLAIAGGTELFALVSHENASGLFEHLARAHILVRKFDYAADWLRVGLAADEQGDRKLAAALASFKS